MQLVFATANMHKLKEVVSLAPPNLQIISMQEAGYAEELPETQETIEGNSLQKAETLSRALGIACFAEDTGLEIEALRGKPGVRSARYAGEDCSFHDNIKKVLLEMQGEKNRSARFKTVITYYSKNSFVQFEGICDGEILESPTGTEGFGYDPIFRPIGSAKSFAQMTLDEKNMFSHRKKSFQLFATFLQSL